jgi:ribonucleotide reductase alpha subunit
MDISHPDIWEFVAVRDPAKGGDINRQCPNLFPAVNVTDNFMEKLTYENEQDRQWNLIDPDDGTCTRYIRC